MNEQTADEERTTEEVSTFFFFFQHTIKTNFVESDMLNTNQKEHMFYSSCSETEELCTWQNHLFLSK